MTIVSLDCCLDSIPKRFHEKILICIIFEPQIVVVHQYEFIGKSNKQTGFFPKSIMAVFTVLLELLCDYTLSDYYITAYMYLSTQYTTSLIYHHIFDLQRILGKQIQSKVNSNREL